MDKKEVLMYSSPTCGYCGRIKKELKEKGNRVCGKRL